MADSAVLRLLDTVQGSVFLAILSVMGIFQHHNPELAHSTIEVLRQGNSVVVILASKDDIANSQKPRGVWLESKEELSIQDLNTFKLYRDQLQLMGHIQGSNFLPIKKAVEVFQQRGLDIIGYNIEVVRENDSMFVLFADKDRPAGTRGSIGKPGFEVELNAQDLTVIRSNFVR